MWKVRTQIWADYVLGLFTDALQCCFIQMLGDIHWCVVLDSALCGLHLLGGLEDPSLNAFIITDLSAKSKLSESYLWLQVKPAPVIAPDPMGVPTAPGACPNMPQTPASNRGSSIHAVLKAPATAAPAMPPFPAWRPQQRISAPQLATARGSRPPLIWSAAKVAATALTASDASLNVARTPRSSPLGPVLDD